MKKINIILLIFTILYSNYSVAWYKELGAEVAKIAGAWIASTWWDNRKINKLNESNEKKLGINVDIDSDKERPHIESVLIHGPSIGLLQNKDIILSVNNINITDIDIFSKITSQIGNSEEIKLNIIRNGKKLYYIINKKTKPILGILMSYDKNKGVIIEQILKNSISKGYLKKNDIIKKYNEINILSTSHLINATIYSNTNTKKIEIIRDDKTIIVEIEDESNFLTIIIIMLILWMGYIFFYKKNGKELEEQEVEKITAS